MKNKIRLTESELHNVIRKCINEALNELNWKTYANAAQKAYEREPKAPVRDGVKYGSGRDYHERSRKFAQAAEDALERDFGYQKNYKSGNKGELIFNTHHHLNDSDYEDIMDNPYKDKTSYIKRKCYADGGELSDVGPFTGIRRFDYDGKDYKLYPNLGYTLGERVPLSDIHKGDKRFKDAITKADDELKNYNNGNYEYVKGKGWQLKK